MTVDDRVPVRHAILSQVGRPRDVRGSRAWQGLQKSSKRSDDEPMSDEIREILKQHGRLSVDVAELTGEGDLYQAGMTSHASVNVMLALEDHFDVEFPDRMLKRSVFESVEAIERAILELRNEAPVS